MRHLLSKIKCLLGWHERDRGRSLTPVKLGGLLPDYLRITRRCTHCGKFLEDYKIPL